MSEATQQDAQLLVQLAELGFASGATESSNWIWSDDFVADPEEFFKRYSPGSEEYGHVLAVARYQETIATLWKHELLNESLLFDWLAVYPLWERMKGILLAMREESGVPQLWENFEAMAEAQVPART
jgi:hypothetical protein